MKWPWWIWQGSLWDMQWFAYAHDWGWIIWVQTRESAFRRMIYTVRGEGVLLLKGLLEKLIRRFCVKSKNYFLYFLLWYLYFNLACASSLQHYENGNGNAKGNTSKDGTDDFYKISRDSKHQWSYEDTKYRISFADILWTRQQSCRNTHDGDDKQG